MSRKTKTMYDSNQDAIADLKRENENLRRQLKGFPPLSPPREIILGPESLMTLDQVAQLMLDSLLNTRYNTSIEKRDKIEEYNKKDKNSNEIFRFKYG